jgi:tryptophan synthase alpha chain
MLYANLVYARGVEAFVDAAAAAGASGLIIPDLPMEEAPRALAACDAAGLALVPLVAPTTPDARLAEIGSRARGFLYTVSVTGTTGERSKLADYASVIRRAKAHTSVPVALGFGIGTPQQAAEAADAGADGVIVGSRLVRAAAEAGDPAEAVRELVSGFATGLAA